MMDYITRHSHRIETDHAYSHPSCSGALHCSGARSMTVDFGYARLSSETVPLNQNAGNPPAAETLLGEQQSNIDVVNTQFMYRF